MGFGLVVGLPLALLVAMTLAIIVVIEGVVIGATFWFAMTVAYPFWFRLVLLWRRPFADSVAATPLSTYWDDRRTCLSAGVIIGLVATLMGTTFALPFYGWAYALGTGASAGIVFGAVVGLAAGPAPAAFARLSAGLDEAIVRIITARPGLEPVTTAMAALTPSLIRAATPQPGQTPT